MGSLIIFDSIVFPKLLILGLYKSNLGIIVEINIIQLQITALTKLQSLL